MNLILREELNQDGFMKMSMLSLSLVNLLKTLFKKEVLLELDHMDSLRELDTTGNYGVWHLEAYLTMICSR